MKTDPSGRSDVSARTDVSVDGGPPRRAPLRRRLLTTAAAVVAALVVAFALRHAIVGALLTRGIGIATGDRVAIGAFRIGLTRSAFSDVRVTSPSGDPLFSARRVTLGLALQRALGDRVHRFGLTAITLESPIVFIVRHRDGSFNLASHGGGSGASSGVPAAPWNLRLRVRDGEVRLIDDGAAAPDLRQQRFTGLRLDARVASAGRTTARGSLRFVGRRTADAAPAAWPIRLGADVDVPRGVGIVRIDATALPLRGPIAFVQHSPAVRIDDGVVGGLALKIFSLDLGTSRAADWHVGGGGNVTSGRLTVAALRRPVRDIRGRLTLTDDGVWTQRLEGSLAGIPVVARGGAFDRLAPTLRLGVAGSGDLARLRGAFGFAAHQPVRGPVRVETLIEAPVAGILIRSAVRIERGAYGAVPFRAVTGRVDYHAGAVVLDGVRGRYGAADVGVGARFLLGGPALDSAIVATARAPGDAVPYAENLAPESQARALALITGGRRGFRAEGSVGVSAPDLSGAGMFAVDEGGVGEFGPFVLSRRDGSSVLGALRLDRRASRSAAWISARDYRVAVPPEPARLPGLNVPAFPPVAGVLTADAAGGGPPSAFGLSGTLHGRELRVGTARLGSGQARLGGTLADVRLDGVRLAGPIGAFAGTAAAERGAFALRGAYDGTLERLVPLTGKQEAHGAVRGEVQATLAGSDVVVQSAGAALRGGSVRGVALDTAAGTIAVRGNRFHLIAASGSIAGRRAVAEESRGTIAVSAPDIVSAALRGTGIPLDGGNVSAYGIADVRGSAPGFIGTVTVADGRAQGYRVAGDAQIALAGTQARIIGATGALGSTYGSIDGAIAGIGAGALRYDLAARVPLGDIDLLRRDLHIPVRNLAGTFGARLHVHGTGSRPFVEGRIDSPEGQYSGLAFRDAGARIVLDPYGVSARDGSLTVGTTQTTLDASIARGVFGVDVRSPAADLADFNDYFDASDTLGGRGSLAFSLRTYGGRVRSQGSVAMTGVRYRGFTLDRTTAHWTMRGDAIVGRGSVRSPAGTMDASATIVPAADADLRNAFGGARYAAAVNLAGLDLGHWIPASGSSLPILGRVDARFTAAGRFPRLALSLDGALTNAKIDGYAVDAAHLHARSFGSRIDVSGSDADLGFAKLAGSGRLGLAAGDPLAFDVRASTADVGRALRVAVPAARGLAVAGQLDAEIRLSGTRGRPTVSGGFDLRDARFRGLVVPRTTGDLALSGRSVELRDADVEFSRGQAVVAGSLPVNLRPFGLGPPHAPLSFDVTARGVDLAQFNSLLPGGTQLGGTVDGRFGVAGTVDRPRLLGTAAISGGSYASTLERAPLQNLDARLVFAGRAVTLQSLHATVGGGTLDASGVLRLPVGSRRGVSYEAKLVATAAKLDFPAYGHGTVDGRLALTSGGGHPAVSGDVSLRDAVIPVSAVYGNGAPAVTAAQSGWHFDPAFRIHAVAGNNVRLRNSIVDIGVTGAVDLTGTLRGPQLAGGFTATDGTISSYNHVFRLVNAAVSFNPGDGAVPTVSARAVSRVTDPDPDPSRNIAGSANIIVTVSGTADSNNLQVTYSSEPAYSQEQIIGLLLDVPALLGAVNFSLNGGPGAPLLRGAPGETNALLPPGVTPEQVSAISFNQEVFSLLNGQFTQRALSPVERIAEKTLGLSDVEFTVDYGGGIGYSLRRQIGKRDFYAFLSQTVSYPERANIGFELVPRPFETINFSFYQQNGVTSLITNATPGEFYINSTRSYTSVQPLGNRSGLSLNMTRRF